MSRHALSLTGHNALNWQATPSSLASIYLERKRQKKSSHLSDLTFANGADIKPFECLGVPITRAKYFLCSGL